MRDKTDKKDKAVASRRRFFKIASLGSVAGGVAIAAGAGIDGAEAAEPEGSGYRETDHVKTVYDLARF